VLIVSLVSVAVRAVPGRVPAGCLPVIERAGLGFSRGMPLGVGVAHDCTRPRGRSARDVAALTLHKRHLVCDNYRMYGAAVHR
jgi:hypothetical protein